MFDYHNCIYHDINNIYHYYKTFFISVNEFRIIINGENNENNLILFILKNIIFYISFFFKVEFKIKLLSFVAQFIITRNSLTLIKNVLS